MKLSVIVPVYNCEKFVGATIDSLLNQGLSDFEILLIDDESADNSGKICDDYSRRYDDVYAYHIKNRGVSAARNFGLEKATGDYITFVDADDTVLENTYSKLICELDKNPYDIIQYNFAYRKNAPKRKNIKTVKKPVLVNPKNALKLCFSPKKIHNSVCTKLFRSEIIKNIRFDENISVGEDLKFTIESCLSAKTIKLTNIKGYVYNINPDSVMNKELNEKIFDAFTVNDWAKENGKTRKVLNAINTYDFIKAADVLYQIFVKERCTDKTDYIIKRIKENKKKIFSFKVPVKYKTVAFLAIVNLKFCKKICKGFKRIKR